MLKPTGYQTKYTRDYIPKLSIARGCYFNRRSPYAQREGSRPDLPPPRRLRDCLVGALSLAGPDGRRVLAAKRSTLPQ